MILHLNLIHHSKLLKLLNCGFRNVHRPVIMSIYPLFRLAPPLLWLFSIFIGMGGLVLTANSSIFIIDWNLIELMATPLKIQLILDSVGILYACVVLLISANVIQFSKFYIKEDIFINRFTVLVILFVVSINILIFIPHFIALLLGWDGLGITSFILVIYYQNPKSLGAGIITALTNRIGDVLILIAIALTINQGHWTIIHMWAQETLWPQVLAITLAAITKRAQIPFSRWLPAAIAAPTPVSALVHSSTLVTAGVFLLIRFYPFLRTFSLFNQFILIVGVSTMIIAGISATTECDIKKIIALSTLRQLGIIITSIGLGLPSLAFFHIVVHALFKALLFICAGCLIASHGHAQELRWIGNLSLQNPITTSCLLLSNSALCGIPFMAGFFSKDIIIETILSCPSNTVTIFLSFLAVGFTSFYSIRFRLSVLWGPRIHQPLATSKERNFTTSPILVIAFLSTIGGAALLWILPFNSSEYIISIPIKLFTISVVILGMLIGWVLSTRSGDLSFMTVFSLNHYASCIIWFLAPLSSQFQLKLPLVSGHYLLKSVDNSWLELASGQGIFSSLTKLSNSVSRNNPASPVSYLYISLLGILVILPVVLL